MSGSAAVRPGAARRWTRCAQCGGDIAAGEPSISYHGLGFHVRCATYRRSGRRGPRRLGASPAGRPLAVGGAPLD